MTASEGQPYTFPVDADNNRNAHVISTLCAYFQNSPLRLPLLRKRVPPLVALTPCKGA